jgi:hypothetical protein
LEDKIVETDLTIRVREIGPLQTVFMIDGPEISIFADALSEAYANSENLLAIYTRVDVRAFDLVLTLDNIMLGVETFLTLLVVYAERRGFSVNAESAWDVVVWFFDGYDTTRVRLNPPRPVGFSAVNFHGMSRTFTRDIRPVVVL